MKALPAKVSLVGAAKPDAARTLMIVMIVNCMLTGMDEWCKVQLLKSGNENVKSRKEWRQAASECVKR